MQKKKTTINAFGKSVEAGLYANIHKKRARIARGSKEKMRKPGSKGAPTEEAFVRSAKTAKRTPRARDMYAE